MNRDSNLDKLLSVAKGPAVDILFSKLSSLNYGINQLPSSELIESKWKSLTVESANKLAGKIECPDLIDKIAIKEKRKTIKRTLAGNKYTNNVTRLYFLQDGLVENDRDQISASLNNLPITTALIYVNQDPTLYNYLNIDRLLRNNSGLTTNLETIEVIKSFDSRVKSNLVSKAFGIDFQLGVQLLELSETTKYEYQSYQRLDLSTADSKSMITFLSFLNEKDCDNFILNNWDHSLLFINSIDKEIIYRILDKLTSLDKATIDVLIEFDKLEDVICNNPRIKIDEPETVLYALKYVKSKKARTVLMLKNQDVAIIEQSGVTIEDFIKEAFNVDKDAIEYWLNNNFGKISLTAALGGLEFYNNKMLTNRVLNNFANSYNLTMEELFSKVSDNVLSKIDSFPRLENYSSLVARLENFENYNLADLYEYILSKDYTNDGYIYEVANKLLAMNPDKIVDWLRSSNNSPELADFILKNKPTILMLVSRNGKLINCDWISNLVDEVTFKSGIGSVYSEGTLTAIMDYLYLELGECGTEWEIALSLINNWTDTLPSLVNAAKSL